MTQDEDGDMKEKNKKHFKFFSQSKYEIIKYKSSSISLLFLFSFASLIKLI